MKLLCFNMQKYLVFVLIIVMVFSCLGVAYPRKALMGGHHEHIMDNGMGFGVGKRYMYPDRNVDNHHNIPRENYNWRGDSSVSGGGGGGDGGDNGRG
ncbi:hypothetical protein P3L10_027007 [Capsicum annuum]